MRRLTAAAAALFGLCIYGQELSTAQRDLNLQFRLPGGISQAKSLLAAGNPKIDATLQQIVTEARTRTLGDWQARAKGLQIPVTNDLINVVATADSEGSVAALSARIRVAGGEVMAVVDDSVMARVPPAAVNNIAAEPTLEYISPQGMVAVEPPAGGLAPDRDGLQGVLMTRANLLHKQGIVGKGVKIGLLDFGFTGYKALMAKGVVPEPRAVKAFGSDGGWDRVNKGVEHGAACAEIIHAMAPEAQIYIASIGDGSGGASSGEIVQAGMWLAAQGVDIVSFSGGGHVGPHNGHDVLDKLVEEVSAKGILWVNAAGNEGASHWVTTTRLNSDSLVLAGEQPFLMMRARTNVICVQVSWDDWGPNPLTPTSSQDFDAYLLAVDPSTGKAEVVKSSENPQNGRGAPIERLVASAQSGQEFALVIRGSHTSHPVRMHVYMLTPGEMAPETAVGSIGIPATSKSALAVGAVNVKDGRLEPFSSQGPTDDGRAKPDVSAPDRVNSLAYKGDFPGTSAACPHVAGFAALVQQARGKLKVADMARVIATATSPLANNVGAGAGLIDGGKISAAGNSVSTSSFAVLDDLIDQAGDDNPVGAKVVVGRSTYKVGDGLKIGFRTEQDASCVLLHRSEGKYTPLLPREGEQLRVKAGMRYTFPDDSGATIRIAGPPSTDEIALICTAWGSLRLESVGAGGTRDLSVSVARFRVEQ